MPTFTAAEGETVLYQLRCNADIPKGKGHKKTPGHLYITDRRIVHDYRGLFGMGASLHQIPLSRVSTVTNRTTLLGTVEVTGIDGSTTRFHLHADGAQEVANLIYAHL